MELLHGDERVNLLHVNADIRNKSMEVHLKMLKDANLEINQLRYIQGIQKRMVRFQKLTRNLFLTLIG
jgi:hypothetical protein